MFSLTAKPVASIEQLLRASSDDEKALQFPLPDSGFGFHAQRAVEKLYKALLAFRNGQYPFSHDLKYPRKHVEAAGIRFLFVNFASKNSPSMQVMLGTMILFRS